MSNFNIFVGLEVQTESINVVVGDTVEKRNVRSFGNIHDTHEAVDKMLRKSISIRKIPRVVYEAGAFLDWSQTNTQVDSAVNEAPLHDAAIPTQDVCLSKLHGLTRKAPRSAPSFAEDKWRRGLLDDHQVPSLQSTLNT